MSQRETAIRALREAGQRGVCLTDIAQLDPNMPYRYRNVISELRHSGVAIESERCTAHRHASTVSRYRLASVDDHPAAGIAMEKEHRLPIHVYECYPGLVLVLDPTLPRLPDRAVGQHGALVPAVASNNDIGHGDSLQVKSSGHPPTARDYTRTPEQPELALL